MRTVRLAISCALVLLAAGCAGKAGGTPVSPAVNGSGATHGTPGTPAPVAPQFPPRYTIVDLGENVQPLAVNNENVAVGNVLYSSAPYSRAFAYRNGALVFLTKAPSGANDINDAGVIVGEIFGADPLFTPQAVRFAIGGGQPVALGTPAGQDASAATSISQTGQIAGISYSNGSYCGGTTIADNVVRFDGRGDASIVTPGAYPAVNDGGTIAYTYAAHLGPSCAEVNEYVAEIPGGAITLPSNHACGEPEAESTSDLNNAGYVVGTYTLGSPQDCNQASPPETAAYISRAGAATEILPPGGTDAQAFAINDFNWVGGAYVGAVDGNYHAFLWSNGVAVDLNALLPAGCLWQLEAAYDVNDLGYVVGVGTYQGTDHGFMLVPSPG